MFQKCLERETLTVQKYVPVTIIITDTRKKIKWATFEELF